MPVSDSKSSRPSISVDISQENYEEALRNCSGSVESVQDLLNHALLEFNVRKKAEALGFELTTFHVNKYREVLKVYAKKIASFEASKPVDAILTNPDFCGILYPRSATEIYQTMKGNIIMKKSVSDAVHYCNGQAVANTANEGTELTYRTVDISIFDSVQDLEKMIPPQAYRTAVVSAGAFDSKEFERQNPEFFELLSL